MPIRLLIKPGTRWKVGLGFYECFVYLSLSSYAAILNSIVQSFI
jgi:hypothetical protein